MAEKSDFYDDDDTPWASPEIRANYEAELGRFTLAFNNYSGAIEARRYCWRLCGASPSSYSSFTRSYPKRVEARRRGSLLGTPSCAWASWDLNIILRETFGKNRPNDLKL